jgi:hypothetical protein
MNRQVIRDRACRLCVNRGFGCRLLIVAFAFSFAATSASAVSVFDGEGLALSQFDLAFPGVSTQPDSQYGWAAVDINQLLTNKSMTAIGGYLNVATSSGWVVQNLPVLPEMLAGGTPGLGVMFDLGANPGDVASLSATADLAQDPVSNFSMAGANSFMVGTLDYNAQGGINTLNGMLNRNGPTDHRIEMVVFEPTASPFSDAVFQPNHPDSIEQQLNQCGPGALANSLHYLEDRFAIGVPHEFSPNMMPNSIMDQIDAAMNRAPNAGVTRNQFLDGKLSYIDNNGLGGPNGLRIKGYGIGGDRTVGDTTLEDQTVSSGLSLVDWLLRELESGEDVELWMDWVGGGAHLVTLTGGGRIFGRPYFTWSHDAVQNDNTQGTNYQTGGTGFSYFDPLRGNFINFIGDEQTNNATFRFAVSESVPEPTTLALLVAAAYVLAGARRPAWRRGRGPYLQCVKRGHSGMALTFA